MRTAGFAPSLGAGGSLVAATVVVALLASALLALHDWPSGPPRAGAGAATRTRRGKAPVSAPATTSPASTPVAQAPARSPSPPAAERPTATPIPMSAPTATGPVGRTVDTVGKAVDPVVKTLPAPVQTAVNAIGDTVRHVGDGVDGALGGAGIRRP